MCIALVEGRSSTAFEITAARVSSPCDYVRTRRRTISARCEQTDEEENKNKKNIKKKKKNGKELVSSASCTSGTRASSSCATHTHTPRMDAL
ncbi:unnamed protein product [Trichogramma brassicae]|uniref:Uncharacterized protein n=1 Tax=Trichogramma brassicae TaxID=86971 RepID=A0A6H5IK20_9HYME|nr:unnamed protein product [Trichogramma brassicae]